MSFPFVAFRSALNIVYSERANVMMLTDTNADKKKVNCLSLDLCCCVEKYQSVQS